MTEDIYIDIEGNTHHVKDMDSIDREEEIVAMRTALEFSKGHKVKLINNSTYNIPLGTEGYVIADRMLYNDNVSVLFEGGRTSTWIHHSEIFDISLEKIITEKFNLTEDPEDPEESFSYSTDNFSVGDFVEIVIEEKHHSYLSEDQIEHNGRRGFITWVDSTSYSLENIPNYYYDFILKKVDFDDRFKSFQATDLGSLCTMMNSFTRRYPNYKVCDLRNFSLPNGGWYSAVLERHDNSGYCEIKG